MLRPALTAAALLALAAPAQAASPFLPPAPLSSPGSSFEGAEMNARGDVAVIWQGSRNLNADPAAGKVEAVRAPAGRPFGPVQRLEFGRVREPQLALGADGALGATWWRERGAAFAGGTVDSGFGAPTALSRGIGLDSAVSPNGHVVDVWTNRSFEQHTATQLLAAYRPPGGDFGPVRVLAEHGYVDEYPAVVVDAAGTAVVAWKAAPSPRSRWQVWTATISPTGQASPPAALSSPAEDVRNGTLRLTTNDRGDVAVAWAGTTEQPPQHNMPWVPSTSPRVAVRPAGGQFGAVESLGGPSGTSPDPRVTLDHRGGALAAWLDTTPQPGGQTGAMLRVARRPPGGTFGAPGGVLAQRVHSQFIRAGVDGRGNTVLVWSEARENTVFDLVLLAAWQRPGGRFSLPTTLRDRGSPDALVFDDAGRGLLVIRDFPAEQVIAFPYVGALVEAPAPPPLAGLAVEARLPRARFLVTEPGKVAATIERRLGRRGFRVVSRHTHGVRRGRRRLVLTDARGRRLGAGTYRLTLQARDLTGRHLAQRRLGFRVGR